MLPSGVELRKKLSDYIQQSVQLLNEVDILKEDSKNIAEMVKEELDMPAKEFNSLVKVAYDRNKIESQIEDLQTAVSNVDILKGD